MKKQQENPLDYFLFFKKCVFFLSLNLLYTVSKMMMMILHRTISQVGLDNFRQTQTKQNKIKNNNIEIVKKDVTI
jgi:hypothetical protein